MTDTAIGQLSFDQVPVEPSSAGGSSPVHGEGSDAGAGHGPASLSKFDPKRAARRTDPPTSHLAARSIVDSVTEMQAKVLAVHRRNVAGMTDDEVWAALPDYLLGSLSKRRGDLVTLGLIEATDERRPTRRNQAAGVYRITMRGIAVNAQLQQRAA